MEKEIEPRSHTPGPWRRMGGGAPEYMAIVANDTYIVLSLADHVTSKEHGNPIKAPDYETQLANARLIAAAPELLEACKAVVAIITDPNTDWNPVLDRIDELMQAAIKKGEGR